MAEYDKESVKETIDSKSNLLEAINSLTINSNQCLSDNNDNVEKTITGKEKLKSWLNKTLKIEISDGRVLIGKFVCTDRDANIILKECTEFLNTEVCDCFDEPTNLGLVIVPGKHIVSIHLEVPTPTPSTSTDNKS